MRDWVPWLLWMALTPALECPPQSERAWPNPGWLSAGNGQTDRFGEPPLEIGSCAAGSNRPPPAPVRGPSSPLVLHWFSPRRQMLHLLALEAKDGRALRAVDRPVLVQLRNRH